MKALKSLRDGCFSLGLLLLCSIARNDAAGPIVYQATGTREQIQPVIDQFKHDIVYGVGGDEQHPPPILGSFAVATFDDLNFGNKSASPPFEFRSGGISFLGGPGGVTLVSAAVTDPSDSNRLFGDIDPSFPSEFQAFSSPSILALQSRGGNFIDAYVSVDTALQSFGAVFVDVDSPSSAAITYLLSGGNQNVNVPVPPASGHGNFSFVGVRLGEGESLTDPMVVFQMPGLGTSSETHSYDLVAIDDVILGGVGSVPEPSPIVLSLIGGVCAWITVRLREKRA